jgi:hypothetical protein
LKKFIFCLSLAVFSSLSFGKGIKPNVAVLDVTGSLKDFTREELMAVTSRLETEIMKTEQYQVLERRNMDMILQEQGFQQTGACNSSECQVEIGQLLGVEKLITGSITKVNDVITLNLKRISVESGANERSHALDIRGELETVLMGGCYEMAQIITDLKTPENTHTVLTAESSLWKWITGGVLVAGGVVTTLLLLEEEPKGAPGSWEPTEAE